MYNLLQPQYIFIHDALLEVVDALRTQDRKLNKACSDGILKDVRFAIGKGANPNWKNPVSHQV